MNKVFLIALIFSLFSCESSKKLSEKTVTDSEINYRFRVSFFSIGSGIDGDAKQEYMNFLRSFEAKMNTNISYEVNQWGKEGETNFCFKLAELSEKDQLQFIAESKDKLKNAKNVRFIENEPCLRN
jgi:hypothetical protein